MNAGPAPSVLASLRARMTLGFTVWFGTFAILACLGFFLWSCHAAHRDTEERVQAAARLVAQEWDGAPSAQSVAKAFNEAREDMRLDAISLLLVDHSHHVLGANRHPPLPWPSPDRYGWLTTEVPARGGSAIAGMNWAPIQAALHRQALLVLTFALFTTAAAGIAAWHLVGRTLRPIGALSDQANTASADPLLARLSPPSQDAEVRRLVDTLNGFLERLRENTRAREQFYAAAAHELRTPLAVLSGSVEVALSRPRTNGEYQETLNDLQQQTQRLTALVQDLLTLNRLDMNPGVEETEAVDLADLCGRNLAALAPFIAERGLKVETDLELTDCVLAPPAHAAILVRNLLENAVKYASPGGHLSVTLTHHRTGVQFRVYNNYPDLDTLELERFFEPFYRADASRSATTGGNGLGLAICRRIARVSGWSLTLQRAPGGVAATATLPVAK